jgi:hypothetical protein
MLSDILNAIRQNIDPDWDDILSDFQAVLLRQSKGRMGDCPSGVERAQALSLAYLCKLAYTRAIEGKAEAERLLLAPKSPVANYHKQIAYSADADLRGFSVCSDTDIVFSCRGSRSLADWITNLAVDLVKEESVHEGFDSAAEAIWPWVRGVITERLSKHGNSFERVIFTGHSLGGAVAVLLAHKLSQNPLPKMANMRIEAHTFGCPLLGSKNLNFTFPLISYRIVGDEIPDLTLPSKKFLNKGSPYIRHGTSYFLYDKFRIIASPTAEQIGLLNWGCMIADVTKRACYLVDNNQSTGADGQAMQFLLVTFDELCKNYPISLSNMYVNAPPIVQLLFILSSIVALMGERADLPDEEQDLLDQFANTIKESELFKAIGAIGLQMQAVNVISEASNLCDSMTKISKNYLINDHFLRACILVITKNRHSIENYINHLSMGKIMM